MKTNIKRTIFISILLDLINKQWELERELENVGKLVNRHYCTSIGETIIKLYAYKQEHNSNLIVRIFPDKLIAVDCSDKQIPAEDLIRVYYWLRDDIQALENALFSHHEQESEEFGEILHNITEINTKQGVIVVKNAHDEYIRIGYDSELQYNSIKEDYKDNIVGIYSLVDKV